MNDEVSRAQADSISSKNSCFYGNYNNIKSN